MINNYLYIDGILYDVSSFSDRDFHDLRKESQALVVVDSSQEIKIELYTESEEDSTQAYNLYKRGCYTHVNQDIIIYHANCSDGLSAAAVALTNMPNAILVPGTYGYPKFNFKYCNIYFVDFSYKEKDMEVLIKTNLSVTLIDHHKTAIDDTRALEQSYENFHWFVSEDNSMSGVGLAWSFWNNSKELPLVYRYIQDRDLWSWELDSKAVLKYIDTFISRTVEEYQKLAYLTIEDLEVYKKDGLLLLAMEESLEDQMIKDSMTFIDIFEYTGIPCLNVHGAFSSNIGSKIMTKYPETDFVILWQSTKKGLKISLRSSDNNEDVSKIAQRISPQGGGHHNAAGVMVQSNHEVVELLLGIHSTY